MCLCGYMDFSRTLSIEAQPPYPRKGRFEVSSSHSINSLAWYMADLKAIAPFVTNFTPGVVYLAVKLACDLKCVIKSVPFVTEYASSFARSALILAPIALVVTPIVPIVASFASILTSIALILTPIVLIAVTIALVLTSVALILTPIAPIGVRIRAIGQRFGVNFAQVVSNFV